MSINTEKRSSRWVCPNDRQLALRAQLGAGWSMHAADQKQSSTISEDEHAQIMRVIEKANNLDNSEALRVGKLVDRLDNIKRSAMGNGSNECILCAQTFGILSSATAIVCIDCKKNVCTECCINLQNGNKQSKKNVKVYLCKICAESRELWKRSGAWFFKSIPNYVLPPPKKRNLGRGRSWRPITSTNEETSNSDKVGKEKNDYVIVKQIRRERSEDSDDDDDDFDEVDKTESAKSFKVDAEFETNGSTTTAVSNQQQSLASLTSDYVTESNQSSPSASKGNESRRSVTSVCSSESPPSTESGKTASDLSSLHSLNESSGSSGTIELSLGYNPSRKCFTCHVIAAYNLRAIADIYAVLKLEPNFSKVVTHRSSVQKRTLNPRWNEMFQFQEIGRNDLDKRFLEIHLFDQNAAASSNFIGQASIALKDIRHEKQQVYKLKLSDRKFSVPKSERFLPHRGEIEIVLTYKKEPKAQLIIRIIQCRHLVAMDKNGLSDPYVKLYLKKRGDRDKKSKHKTSIKKKTLNPVYDEEFRYYDSKGEELFKKVFRGYSMGSRLRIL